LRRLWKTRPYRSVSVVVCSSRGCEVSKGHDRQRALVTTPCWSWRAPFLGQSASIQARFSSVA
jgi:hypothetical protein